jgi:hypothetical protein
MKKNKGFIFALIAIAIAAAVVTAVVQEVVETAQQTTSQSSGSSSISSGSSGSTCPAPKDCEYPLKTCKICDGATGIKCISVQQCVKKCPPPCTTQECIDAAKKTTYNKCVNGKCVSVTEEYDIHGLKDECGSVGSSCDPGCGFSECIISTIVNHPTSGGGSPTTADDVSPIAGYAYACRPSVYAKSNECISSSDCKKKFGSSSTSSSKFCLVTATASPKNLSEDQSQVTISATNLKHTSLSKCKVSGYSLPYTFTQDASSKTYKVSCTGNSGYKNCSSSIKVTKEGGIENGDNGDNGDNEYYEIVPCIINKFELPKRAWVDIETIASWSTNNCTTAEINCISDDCIEGVENLSGSVEPGFDQNKNFTIYAPGTYRYELEACGPNNCDTYVNEIAFGGTGDPYIEIEALHLPWWQEIIPVLPDNLQGFLRGILGNR